ncbi:MAG: hypothetical protein AAGC55_14780 [Myxococcota bacterium]
MTFELVYGLIYVPMQIDYADQQVDLRAIADTGSAGTAANINLFNLDYHRDGRIRDLVGIGGKERVIVQNVERVSVGDSACEQFPIEFSDMDGAFDIEAIIGSDLLERFGAVIDYPAKQLHFQS